MQAADAISVTFLHWVGGDVRQHNAYNDHHAAVGPDRTRRGEPIAERTILPVLGVDTRAVRDGGANGLRLRSEKYAVGRMWRGEFLRNIQQRANVEQSELYGRGKQGT